MITTRYPHAAYTPMKPTLKNSTPSFKAALPPNDNEKKRPLQPNNPTTKHPIYKYTAALGTLIGLAGLLSLKGQINNLDDTFFQKEEFTPAIAMNLQLPVIKIRTPEMIMQEEFPDGIPDQPRTMVEGALNLLSDNNKSPIDYDTIKAYKDNPKENGGDADLARKHDQAQQLINEFKLNQRDVFNMFAGEDHVLDIADIESKSTLYDTVNGRRIIATQTGTASWYGPGFHGKHSKNGEIFNQYGLTLAHNNPAFMNKDVLVTSLTSGKSVIARVTDTGAFTELGRVADLSAGTADAINLNGYNFNERTGTGPVKLQVLE